LGRLYLLIVGGVAVFSVAVLARLRSSGAIPFCLYTHLQIELPLMVGAAAPRYLAVLFDVERFQPDEGAWLYIR
jgi:hypothetical protein